MIFTPNLHTLFRDRLFLMEFNKKGSVHDFYGDA